MSDGHTPKILCVAGSPRRRGNSERLLEACVSGIREAEGEPDLLIAAEAGVLPCRGCNSCAHTGRCVIVTDGMAEVNDRIDAASAIIVSTPVYFATVPAVLKTVYDRLQPYWTRAHRLGQPRSARRPGALLVVRGGGDPFGFSATADTTRSVFAVLGIDLLAELCVEGPDAPDDILGYPAELARAVEIGIEIVAAARLREGTG